MMATLLFPPSTPSQIPAQKAVRCLMQSAAGRAEERVPVKVAVDLAGVNARDMAQSGVTENVSGRGARVVTGRPWRPNEHVKETSLRDGLRWVGRVVYCDGEAPGWEAVGLELIVKVRELSPPLSRAREAA